MSDLPITPEQALQLVEIMQAEAQDMIRAGNRDGFWWLHRANELQRYIEASAALYEQNARKPTTRDMS